jgi:membrane associated rhomboid family serine protease
MSWRDRNYYQGQGSYNDGGGMAMGFPKPTLYVKYLLIANIAMFVLTSLVPRIELFFVLPGAMGLETFTQPWRLVTYQFLHANITHILFNMLGLYFFGPPLERLWGSNRFLYFYLLCGTIGGLAFVVLSTLIGDPVPIVGASGAILGLLTACAILFPQMIIILILFPVPIRFAAILLAGMYGLNVLRTRDLADACHLAGMITAFLYIMASPWWQRFRSQQKVAKRESFTRKEESEQEEVDRILEKVHQHGIQSLSGHEKKVLQDATQRQRQRGEYQKREK